MSKEIVFFQSQRRAFDVLANPTLKDGSPNKNYVRPESITIPSILIQEQQLTNANNTYSFNFGTKSIDGTDVLNNVILGDNDIAVVYGIQVLLGQGATKNIRQYRAYGPSVQDNVVYNGLMSIKLEQNTLVNKMDMISFRKEHGTFQDQWDGAIAINPLRIVTGRVSTFSVNVDLPKVNGLTFTPNLFISVRLLIALGQASAVK